MTVQRDLFSPAARRPLTVSQLTNLIKNTLEDQFPSVWVSGELSDVARPQSGHVYFTLKDDAAQIRGVIWKGTAQRLKFRLEDGLAVLCQGEIDVYPPRGSYQLVVQSVEPQGLGGQQLALAQLKAKLAAEGLFAAERKRPLPVFSRRIAIVTSPTGAAVHDFLEVLRRRWRAVDVLVIPARVQGEGAAAEIAQAIRIANRITPRADVLVVARGGGSTEDLWCFNDEQVVRAVCGSRIPVVSAVGHEIDVTLCDLAADLRALTPSEAAERVTPLESEIRDELRHLRHRLAGSLLRRFQEAQARVRAAAQCRALRRPLDRVRELGVMVDELADRAERAMQAGLAEVRQRVAGLAGRLDSLSPLAVLARGYSLTMLPGTGRLVRDASSLRPGQQIETRLAKGQVISRVEKLTIEGEMQ